MKKIMSFLLSFVILSSSIAYADGLDVSRIAGKDRYQTDLMVNNLVFKGRRNTAVLVNGSDFAFALQGSYLASTMYIPYYLSGKSGVNPVALRDMKKRGVKNVYILGGYTILDKSVEKTLRANGMNTRRLCTDNTPIEKEDSNVDKELWKIQSKDSFNAYPTNYATGDIDRSIFVNDKKFPDTLSVIPFAARSYKQYHTALTEYRAHRPRTEPLDCYGFAIIGGPNTITKYLYSTQHSGAMSALNRIAGKDRYETAVKIAQANNIAFDKKLSKTVVLVSGENYPDALASGVLAMYYNAPVLLTQKNALNGYTKDYLVRNRINKVVVIGGENSVSSKVIAELKNLK